LSREKSAILLEVVGFLRLGPLELIMKSSIRFKLTSMSRTGALALAVVGTLIGASGSAFAGQGQIITAGKYAGDGRADIARKVALKKYPNAISQEEAVLFLPQISVKLKANVNVDLFAAYYGLTVSRVFPGNQVVLNAPQSAIPSILKAMAKDTAVELAVQETKIPRAKHAFTPNDPFYAFNNPAGFKGQWHLINTNNHGGANIDVKAGSAWNIDITGLGVVIGIVDDGLERTHEDLVTNYSAADSFDFGQSDGDPTPVYSDDDHGTAVSGVIGARGGNGIGVTGIAPFATLAGLRCDFVSGTTTMFSSATSHRSSGANKQIKIKNHSYGYTASFLAATAEAAALATSTADGTIHCFSAGNSRGSTMQDTARAQLQSDPNAIVVAALNDGGTFTSYSSFGSSVFITAPSSDSTGIMTVDRTGAPGYNPSFDTLPNTNYTSVFGGTSSSSPLVAGVLGLVKQVQPALNTRFAKHLLARFSDQVNVGDTSFSSDGGWKTNGAGLKFNPNFGFGNINVQKLITNAPLYSGVTALATTTTGVTTVNAAIPDATVDTTSPGIVSRTFSINSTAKLEEVQVSLNLTHTFRGDIEAYITSPSGLKSRLISRVGSDGNDNLNWTFSTNAFWGENPAGTWTIELRDYFVGDTGTWTNYNVTMRQGELIAGTPVNDAQFISQSVPTTMYLGRPYSVSVTVRNSGTTTWSQADLFSLVSENPFSNSNFGTNRRDLSTGETVPPGASRTFTFTATAPATAGTYNFQWRMRRRSAPVASFGEFTTNVPVNVIDGNNAGFFEQSIPTMMGAGTKYEVLIRYFNTGSRPWTFDLYRLISQNPYNNTTWGISNVQMGPTETINPGGRKQWYFKVQAPSTPGTYNMQWRMRRLGVEDFGDLTPNVAVVVRTPRNSSFVSQTAPTTMVKGTTQSVTVRMRNTGAFTWGSGYSLISQNTLGNTRWGVKSVPLGAGETIAPDAEKTFTFNITAPNTAGTYNFQWQMYSGGTFGAASTNIPIVVTN